MIFYGKDEHIVRPHEPLLHIDTMVTSEYPSVKSLKCDWDEFYKALAEIDLDTPTVTIETYREPAWLTGYSTDNWVKLCIEGKVNNG